MPTTDSTHFDIIIVGAGVGGICGAIAAARTGAKVLLLEAAPEIGGTGVHSPVALVCKFADNSGRNINMGHHCVLLDNAVENYRKKDPVYDEKVLKENYHRLISAEPTLTVKTSSPVERVEKEGDRITAVTTTSGETYTAKIFLDGTADGNLSAIAGAEFQKGRAADGHMQPSTLTFKVTDLDFSCFPQSDLTDFKTIGAARDTMNPIYHRLQEEGKTSNPRENVLCFPYPDGKSLLFNTTRITGVDPTDPENLKKSRAEGEKQVHEIYNALKAEHPAFKNAHLEFISEKLGVREGRRIVGDYLLTGEDCLGEARFEDMIAACSYDIDIHNPDGKGTLIQKIPNSGYYHIPYRSLIAKGFPNLLLSSRCISGTHEAHSSYRVMSSLSCIGQAAGVAAGLAVSKEIEDVRKVNPAQIRFILQEQKQFVDAPVENPYPGK